VCVRATIYIRECMNKGAGSLASYIIFPTLLTKRARLFVTQWQRGKVCSLENYQNSDICMPRRRRRALLSPAEGDEFAALEKCLASAKKFGATHTHTRERDESPEHLYKELKGAMRGSFHAKQLVYPLQVA
jgi:hypothetical protein